MNRSIFLNILSEHADLIDSVRDLDVIVAEVGVVAAKCLNAGGKIMICGNGGSAADSQHLAAELVGRFVSDRKPLAAVALATDTSIITCIGNDYSFDEIFSRQVQGLGRFGDLLIAISTSGNSGNVIKAAVMARRMGLTTVGLIGNDGGRLRSECEYSIIVPTEKTARIQEFHILICHALCSIIEDKLNLG